MLKKWTAKICTGFLVSLTLGTQALAAEVNLYSARKENLVKPLLERFTADTGIRVNLVTGKADALLKRLWLNSGQYPNWGEHPAWDRILMAKQVMADCARYNSSRLS